MVPELDVFDLEESVKFYVDLIGFHIVYERKEDRFAFLQLGKVQLMIQELDKDNNKWEVGKLEYSLGRGINFQIDVTNIDEIYSRLRENKYNIFVDMEENWYRRDNLLMGSKEFLVLDPNGYLFRFSEDIETKEIEK